MLSSPSFLWQPDVYLFESDFFSLRWYSVLFVLAFFIGRFIVVRSYKVEKRYDITVDIQLVFMILGTLIGSRVGHVIFYEPHILNRGVLEGFWRGQSWIPGPRSGQGSALLLRRRPSSPLSFGRRPKERG